MASINITGFVVKEFAPSRRFVRSVIVDWLNGGLKLEVFWTLQYLKAILNVLKIYYFRMIVQFYTNAFHGEKLVRFYNINTETLRTIIGAHLFYVRKNP